MSNGTNVESDFAKYALSYSGMDGGNLNAPLWICGIEFGGELAEGIPFKRSDKIPCWTDASPRMESINEAKITMADGKRQTSYKMWPFCRMASKLTVAVLSGAISGWRQHYYTDKEHKGYCGARGGNFSLNLFPITFRRIGDAEWTDKLRTTTGFQSSDQYRAWCREHRFPWLRELVQRYRPATVVCCSAAKTRNYFLSAFSNESARLPEPFKYLGKKKLPVYKLEGCTDKTSLWIVPFLGQGGILANGDIEHLGTLIRADILNNSNIRLEDFLPQADTP